MSGGDSADKRCTRGDHRTFCVNEEWTEVPSTHHVTFKLTLPDGRKLRTRLSRKPDSTMYGPGMFAHVLRDQLEVSAEAFWACVDEGVLPDRGFGPEVPKETLPTEVVFQLVYRVGVPEQEVAGMSREQAITRLNQFWTQGR